MQPVGDVGDSPDERYEFALRDLTPGEHTVAVRANDDEFADNLAAAEVTFSASAAKEISARLPDGGQSPAPPRRQRLPVQLDPERSCTFTAARTARCASPTPTLPAMELGSTRTTRATQRTSAVSFPDTSRGILRNNSTRACPLAMRKIRRDTKTAQRHVHRLGESLGRDGIGDRTEPHGLAHIHAHFSSAFGYFAFC